MGNQSARASSSHGASGVSEFDLAVLEIKIQRDKLTQHTRRIQKAVDRETAIAKEHARLHRSDLARLALRKRKCQVGMLDKCEAMKANMGQMVAELEQAQIEAVVVQGLKVGTAALQKVNEEPTTSSPCGVLATWVTSRQELAAAVS
jgi:charged multivesicular body protein 6